MGARPLQTPRPAPARAELAAGWAAMLPFWLAALPGAMAYGLAARAAGMGPAETMLFSLLTFSAPAQLSAVGLLAAGVAAPLAALIVAAQSVHLLILGVDLAGRAEFGRLGRPLAALLLTDAAWAVSVARGRLTPAFYAGAGLSMYAAWALGTGLTLALGGWLPALEALGPRAIGPLAFAVLLAPLLRRPADLAAALGSAGLTLALAGALPAPPLLPAAAAAGAALGWLASRGEGARP